MMSHVALIYIPVMNNLLSISSYACKHLHIFSFKSICSNLFIIKKIRLFIFMLLNCNNSLYILDTNFFSKKFKEALIFENIFSHILACLILLTSSVKKVILILIKFHLFFSFMISVCCVLRMRSLLL